MTFQDLYPGQRVRILSWDELNSIGHHDSAYSAYGIHLPDNTFFNNEMKYLCGATLTIVSEPSYYSDSDKDYLSPNIFQFDDSLLSLFRGTPFTVGFRRWLLSPAMLAPLNESPSAIPPAISFDQLITGGELPQ